MWYNG